MLCTELLVLWKVVFVLLFPEMTLLQNCFLAAAAVLTVRSRLLRKISRKLDTIDHLIQLIIMDTFVFAFGIYAAAVLIQRYTAGDLCCIACFLAIILYINIELAINQYNIKQQKQKLEIYQQYLPIVEDLISQVRERQHNYNNQLQSIQSLLSIEDDSEELRKRLMESVNHYSIRRKQDDLLKMNMHLLAGLLASKYTQAEKAGIRLDMEIRDYNLESQVEEFVLVDLFGILIDNAIEACSQGQKIQLFISDADHRIHMEIKNPGPVITPELSRRLFQKGYTTKEGDGHGFGLYHLSHILKENRGSIEIRNEEIDGCCNLVFVMEI